MIGRATASAKILRSLWNKGWLPGLFLAIATILAYQPAWNAGYIWDDDRYVTHNRLLTDPDGLKKIWFSLDSPSQYCPLVYTSFRFEQQLSPLNPSLSHCVNLLLHTTNALLLALVLRRLGVPGAWLAGALFALHPVNVESVAWISERKNVLCLLFYLLALLAWIDFVRDSTTKRPRAYAFALLFYALALLSKTVACTFPVTMLLILWLKRLPISRTRLAQLLPFLLLGFGMGFLTMWWERYHQGTMGKPFSIGWVERILIASRAIFFYLGKLIWPANLTFSYPRWTINATDPLAYVWLIALFGIAPLIFWARRFLGRSVETAAIFYVASLSPLLGFIMLYTFRYTYVADHYQYIACLGPIALAGTGFSGALTLSRSRGRIILVIAAGLVLSALSVLTWRQCRMYVDVETLWRTTISRNPGSFLAHNNLGTLLLREARIDEALSEFQKVVAIAPDYEVGHYDLGHALLRRGQLDAAISELRKAVELDPSYANAHNNLANALLSQGKPREALEHYEAALKLRPNNADFANNLAALLATSREDSIRDGQRAVTLARQAEALSRVEDPGYIATLAAAYAETGRFSEAIAEVQRALELAKSRYNPNLTSELNQQLELYQVHKPLRAGPPPATQPTGQDSK